MSTRYLVTETVWINGRLVHADSIEELAPSDDVAVLLVAGKLRPESEDGTFPPVTVISRCCGG